MAPAHRPSSPLQAALARVDLGRVHAQIVAYAISRLRSRDAGEELAQRVLVEAIDPDGRPWDPAREPDLARHLVGRVNSAILNDYKKARVRSDPRAHDTIERLGPQPMPRPDELLDARRRSERDARCIEATRASFEAEGDTLALRVLGEYASEVTGAAEQARALGADVREVYEARRRIARRARTLRVRQSDTDGPPLRVASTDEDEEVAP